MKLHKIFLALLPLLAVSCVKTAVYKPEVRILVSKITFSSQGGEKTVEVSTRYTEQLNFSAWTDSTFTETADWIDISGDRPRFTIKASVNDGPERTAVLRAVASNPEGSTEVCVPVVQAGKTYDPNDPNDPNNPNNPNNPGNEEPEIELDKDEATIPAEGGSLTVAFTTNAEYVWVDWYDDNMDDVDWIDIADDDDPNANSVKFTIKPNTGEERYAIIEIDATMVDWEAYGWSEEVPFAYALVLVCQEGAQSPDPGYEPQPGKWNKVRSTSELESGYYLIVCESESIAFNGSLSFDKIDSNRNWKQVTISNSAIDPGTEIDACAFWYDASDGSLRAKDGYYIDWTSSTKNGLSTSNSAAALTVTVSDGEADIMTSSSSHLRYNSASDQLRFRFFKSSTYAAQKAVQLYKMPEVSAVPSFSVSTTVLSAGPKATEASFSIDASADVEWTAVSSSPDFTLSAGSGSGSAEIKVRFTANPTASPRSATITVATTNDAVETKSWTVTISQGPASEGDIDDGTPGYDDHLISRRII